MTRRRSARDAAPAVFSFASPEIGQCQLFPLIVWSAGVIHELKSVRDVWRRLPSEDHARKFLEELVWREDRVCPHCGSLDSIPLCGKSGRPGLYHCRDCRGQFTVTTRTPMHATKLELRVWIAAIFLVLTLPCRALLRLGTLPRSVPSAAGYGHWPDLRRSSDSELKPQDLR